MAHFGNKEIKKVPLNFEKNLLKKYNNLFLNFH